MNQQQHSDDGPQRRLLLHICCGPCGSASLERLQRHGWEVTLFYSNSNLFPEAEFEKRLTEVRKLAASRGCEVVVDRYDHAVWRERVRGLEGEPERGARCLSCFEFSLSRAAAYAREHGFDRLTTTLTISPHKRSKDIFAIGRRVYDGFLDIDFKKEDGFRRSLELARQLDMYRQDYCGCEFSLAERRRREGGTEDDA